MNERPISAFCTSSGGCPPAKVVARPLAPGYFQRHHCRQSRAGPASRIVGDTRKSRPCRQPETTICSSGASVLDGTSTSVGWRSTLAFSPSGCVILNARPWAPTEPSVRPVEIAAGPKHCSSSFHSAIDGLTMKIPPLTGLDASALPVNSHHFLRLGGAGCCRKTSQRWMFAGRPRTRRRRIRRKTQCATDALLCRLAWDRWRANLRDARQRGEVTACSSGTKSTSTSANATKSYRTRKQQQQLLHYQALSRSARVLLRINVALAAASRSHR